MSFNQSRNAGFSYLIRILLAFSLTANGLAQIDLKKGGTQPSKSTDRISGRMSDDESLHAIQLLDEVLATADSIKPIEYSILASIDGATLLWDIDRERSLSILKGAIKSARKLLEDRNESTTINRYRSTKERRFWALLLRKIAALKPDIIPQLLLDVSPSAQDAQTLKGEWTEEARVTMTAAWNLIEKDPRLAARLAEQSMALGIGYDYAVFLTRLARRDNGQAERLATLLLDRMRDSSVSPLMFSNLNRFFLGPDRSERLKNYFLESAAVRLRRDIAGDAPLFDLDGSLIAARNMKLLATTHAPTWYPEFDSILNALEALAEQQGRPLPGTPARKTIGAPLPLEAAVGDTSAISKQVARVEAMTDAKARDREYQNLAARAAVNADLVLAENLISKIEDEGVRSETTIRVYSPFVRTAIRESDWVQAQRYALKILDPLGLTLGLRRVGDAMSKAGEETAAVTAVFGYAVDQLNREKPHANVARAFLIIGQSLVRVDQAAGFRAMNSAFPEIDQLAKKDELFEQHSIAPSLSSWVSLSSDSSSVEQTLDLIEMLGAAFSEMAKREKAEAMLSAAGLRHDGIRALAHLAICRGLLEKTKGQKAPKQRS